MSAPSLLAQSFAPRCPRCGEGKLFAGMLRVAPHCAHCQLDLARHDAGDGPMFFVITLVGFIVMGAAAYVEFAYMPPMWLHAALWLPLTFLLCIWGLRAFKAMLITLELHTGRLGDQGDRS